MIKQSILKKKAQDYSKAQLKAIDVFKWLESEKSGRDLKLEAYDRWVKEGGAKKFRKSFTVEELKQELGAVRNIRKLIRVDLTKILKNIKNLENYEEAIMYDIGVLEKELIKEDKDGKKDN